MKSIKSLLALALAAGALSTASAASYNGNPVIYITGSTAFRSAANAYLYNTFGANLFATDKTATNTASAGNLYFTNCLVNGTRNDIAVYWSGSEAGIQTAANGTNGTAKLPFFDYSLIANNAANAANLTTNGSLVWYKSVSGYSFNGNITASSTNANTSLQKGNIAFSDTKQSVSAFTIAKGYKTLTETKIGVVPMGFYANNGAPITNITTTVINQLLSSGQVFGNLMTGNLSDTNVAYYMVGRFPDSGTRITAHLAAKAGALSSAVQFNINANASGSITNLDVTAAGTVNGLAVAKGNNGYASGGTLAGLLTNVASGSLTVTDSSDTNTPLSFTVPSSNYVIGYAGVSDAAGTTGYTTGALKPLAYNGVVGRFGIATDYNNGVTSLDQGYTNIINGSYPFWAYEYITYDAAATNAGGVSTSSKWVATNAATVIKSWNSTNNYVNLAPNISLTDMKVNRSVDGGAIKNN